MANNQLLASDNFASGSLAAGWSAWPGLSESAVHVGIPNVTQPSTTSATQGEIWTGLAFPTDQICEVVINNLASSGNAAVALAVRLTGVANSSGYECLINPTANGSSAVQINRNDAGTPTNLAVSSETFSFSAGDVWTFAAMGSCLLVYQNGTRIFYVGDATYTSGSPGIFVQSNSSAASSAQISAFRGYSAQQQDGVWTKKGVVLAATSAELADATIGNGVTGFEGMSFGPARFLTGNVYRGYLVNGSGMGYAESTDGINWSRYPSNPIISGTYGIDVYLHNGTYYVWCQTTPGSSTPVLYTSTDGIAFTSQGSTDIPTGYYAGIHIIDVVGGTFYGLISKLGGSAMPATYLVTSTDALHWAFQNSGNPIIPGTFCGCQISKVNGVYYFWATQNQPGQGNPDAPDFDPLEAVRYSSTNLTTWEVSSHSVHNDLLVDSFNTNTGGVAPCAVIDVNGKAYMYYQGSPGDAIGPQIYQAELAIAPTSLAGLVLESETAQPQIASDDFERGAGGLGPNWTVPTGASALQISASGIVEASALNTISIELYTGSGAMPEQQYSEVTIKALSGATGDQYIIPIVLAQTGSLSFYGVQLDTAIGTISSDSSFEIFKKVNGSNSQIGSSANFITLSVGDVIRLAATTGSDGSIVLTVYQNGFQVLQAQDYAATFTSGYPGIFMYATDALTDAQISAWGGGNANQNPVYPSFGGSWVQAFRDFANKRGLR